MLELSWRGLRASVGVCDAAFLIFSWMRFINIHNVDHQSRGDIYRSMCKLQTGRGQKWERCVSFNLPSCFQPLDQQLGVKLLVSAVGNESQLIHLPRAPKCQLSSHFTNTAHVWCRLHNFIELFNFSKERVLNLSWRWSIDQPGWVWKAGKEH